MDKDNLPHWAIGKLNGEYLRVGAQLLTRDGRHTGNAYIHKIEDDKDFVNLATVITDIGTIMKMTHDELKSLYYPPIYQMDVKEALKARLR